MSQRPVKAKRAWNSWFHCMSNTYGTWLRGDPRGWRSRNHREHVDGDYRSPPPRGKYKIMHDRSKSLMKRDRVLLNKTTARTALNAVVECLIGDGIEVVV